MKVAYEWGKTFVVEAYAECGAVKSEEVSAECYFEPSVPTISVSKAMFDEATMTVSFEVTPSEDTHHWYWGPYGDVYPDSPSAWTYYMDNESRTVNYVVEYDKTYQFTFRAENAVLKGEEKRAEFAVMSPGVDIAIEDMVRVVEDGFGMVREDDLDFRALFVDEVRVVLDIVNTGEFVNVFAKQFSIFFQC